MKTNISLYQSLVFAVIAIGIIARLYQFGKIPNGLNRDEAALGYNAFAIAGYGVDEWGERYPYMFKSFGDYKLPGYIYSVAPFVALFGPQDWVIRLPSLFAGLAQIRLIYHLGILITKNRNLALFAAAILAISPWALFYSRTAYEANLALAFLLAALLLLLKPLTHWSNMLWLSICIVAAISTYNTPLLLVPVLIMGVLLLKKSRTEATYTITAVLIPALIIFLVILPLTSQKSNITIFTDPTIASEQRQHYADSNNFLERMRWHHLTNFIILSGKHWLETFSPNFLVIEGGDHPWHAVPNSGHHLALVYLLFILGVVHVARKSKQKHKHRLLLLLLFLSPLPAIVTVDAPHATRSLLTFVLISLVAAIGLNQIHSRYPKFAVIIMLLLPVEFGLYAHTYHNWYPDNHPTSWPSSLPNAIGEALENTPENSTIYITDPHAQPYIFVLLHEKISPLQFQDTVQYGPPDNAGLIKVEELGRYKFIDKPLLNPGDALISNQEGPYQYVRQ